MPAVESPRQDRRAPRTSLSAHIAKSLREDIYFGRLEPGTHLAQQQLCEEFGTSRMPVRDALRELVHDGLLVQDSAMHTVVAPLTRRDILDSFRIEGVLNGLGAQMATERFAEADNKVLTDLHDDMLRASAANNLPLMTELNWKFHRHINRLSGSSKLLSAIRTSSWEVPRDFLAHVPDWMDRSNDEHLQIVEAMRDGDGVEANRLMTAHIAASGEGLVNFLRAKGLNVDAP